MLQVLTNSAVLVSISLSGITVPPVISGLNPPKDDAKFFEFSGLALIKGWLGTWVAPELLAVSGS